MNAILAIAALIAAVTAREIVRAVAAHVKAKDVIKVLKAAEEAAEEENRAAEAKKNEAEIEKIRDETKAALANKLSGLNDEQLAAYNRTLDEASRPAVQYIPAIPYVPWPYSQYNYSLTQWRGW